MFQFISKLFFENSQMKVPNHACECLPGVLDIAKFPHESVFQNFVMIIIAFI